VKTYLALTATVFGLLTIVHIWRAIVEPSARNPWFFLMIAVSALPCVWALRLWRRSAVPT
jgi:hypothetical protein